MQEVQFSAMNKRAELVVGMTRDELGTGVKELVHIDRI